MTLPATKKQESDDSQGGGGGGFFGIMKKSGSSSKNNRGRKVLKAIPPPVEERNTETTTEATIDTDSDDRDMDRDAKRYALPGSAPAVEDETLRELSEKRRKERLDATASKMKEQREKGVDQRRKSSTQASGAEASGDVPAAAAADDAKDRVVPEIFSVQNKFPEHKRTTTGASLPEDEEPLEKRYKVDSNPDDDSPSSSAGASAESWMDGISGWMKIAVPAVAIAAVLAVVLIKKKK